MLARRLGWTACIVALIGCDSPPESPDLSWRRDLFSWPDWQRVEGAIGRPDLAPPCGEKQQVQVSSSCGGQSVSCVKTVDGECDGLPGARDPWPSTCNKLLLTEDFAAPPARWARSGVWSCGSAELGGSGSLLLKEAPGLSDSSYFTEVRFTLGSVREPTRWAITLRTAHVQDTDQHRICELWVDPTYQPKPGLHSHLYAMPQVAGCNAGMWSLPGTSLPAEDGRSYILQSWSSGTIHHCRLFSGDGATLVHELVHDRCSPPAPGTVMFSTSGRGAIVDFIRVYDF